MLTRKQILKISKNEEQNDGFYEPNFDKLGGRVPKCREKGKHTVKLKLVYVKLPCGDVVIQKADKKGAEKG